MKDFDFVAAIPCAYMQDSSCDFKAISDYCDFLLEKGATRLMTTAGTSQFGLLDLEEVHSFNKTLAQKGSKKILGIPALSLKKTQEFIRKAKAEYLDQNSKMMLLYPERYYGDDCLLSFFSEAVKDLDGYYIHGMKMRKGNGGEYNYEASIFNNLKAETGLLGIKEEHSNLAQSYNLIQKLDPEIDVIVAGGRMRRHQFLYNAGANSFLSGIGNIEPKIEAAYCTALAKGDMAEIHKCLDLEARLFEVFMKAGWHKALRIAASTLFESFKYSRKPWPETSDEEFTKINHIIKEVLNDFER